jgi:predicted Rossmann-fold nucleotide-binding protein
MRERADAFVLLPGGIGSFDEVTEILELKKHNLHDNPIVILNTDDFYGGLRSQLERMRREGFIARPLEEYLHFAATPEEALSACSKQ